ncbi:dTDP-glucose 4,6-dehydratase [Patescibacteria group bacterium]|nr:MAG: dTDP-glucose 4,6-dehydratase [Patescibacteria group bacterium]
MKLLVTGGAGFIGSAFVRYTIREHADDRVVTLDALTYAGNLENLADVKDNPRHEFVHGDVCDRRLVREIVKASDAVVHFAAESHVDRSIAGASDFVRTNVLGTLSILDAVKEHGKRLHHISTDEVFGALKPDDRPFNEHSCYAPRNPYSASKAAADHLVRSYVITHGVKATISNCSNNYGPYHFPEKMIPLFITNLLSGKKVPVYGDGQQVRDWIYVEDHVRGVDLALREGKVGETYLFGGDGEISNLELTKKLIALCGRDESAIENVADRPGHDRRYAIDYGKAKRELGWEPKIGLDEGLKRTVKWFKANQDWVARSKRRG